MNTIKILYYKNTILQKCKSIYKTMAPSRNCPAGRDCRTH